MAFHGLFIGVNTYNDPRVAWLSGAVRDAQALHALFVDNLGDARLLTDEEATTDAIRAELADLASRSTPDDVVVVAFAGHGSDDHHLLPFDADPSDLVATAIALDDFGDLVAAIPAQSLLCVLDCCFSGALGARVFTPEFARRGVTSTSIEDALGRFTGQGRVALTASAHLQPALESRRHGHGLLTFRLLEALRGAPEVVEGRDHLSLLSLIEYVIRHVEADALQMGEVQTPTMRGRLDGAPLWPVLRAGDTYAALFPGQVRPHATADAASLIHFGVAPEVVSAWSGSIDQLNDLQLSAINDFGLMDGEDLVVTAPTSSGKTLIGELAALRAAGVGERSVFLLPMRALVNDKYRQFVDTYGPLGIRTIRATGEHSDEVPDLLRGRFGIALLTYEKFSMLALANPHVLDLATTVVVDETQTLADPTRGSNLEFLLTLLNSRRGRTGAPQIITLSAVVGNLGGLDRWLGGRNLHSEVRPIPLVEGVLDPSGGLHFVDEDGSDGQTPAFIQPTWDNGSRRLLIPLVQRLVGEGKQVIVFRQTKGEAVAGAVYLSRALGLEAATSTLDQISGESSTLTETLRETLASGVAFHTADLDRDERRIVEETFREPDSPIRVISATPTLAMGVNTPAAAVAIVGLTHPGPTPTPYTVAEYKNMVGRAGRLGWTPRGESYLIPEGQLGASTAWNGYVHGRLEDLHSRLVPDGDPRSLILRVLATYPPDEAGRITEADILGFLDASFAAFQAREGGNAQWTSTALTSALHQLASAELVDSGEDGYQFTELGRFAGEAGVHVDSIIRLVHALRGNTRSLNSIGLIAAAQITVEMDDIYLPVNARAKNTEAPRWPTILHQQGVPDTILQMYRGLPGDPGMVIRRAKRAVAAAYWIDGHAIGDIEIELTRHMRQRGGVAGAIRSVADRTRDLLPAVAAVCHQIDPDHPLGTLTDRTMIRLELGIPASLIALATTLDADLSRSALLRLGEAGLTTASDVVERGVDAITQVIGDRRVAERLVERARSAEREPRPLELSAPTE